LNKVEKPFLFLNRPNPYLSPFLHLICPILASGLWVVQLISGNQIKSDSSNLFHSATFEPVARQLRFNIPHPSKGGRYPKSKSHRPIFGERNKMKIVCHTRQHTHSHTHMPLIYFALRIIQIKISQLTVVTLSSPALSLSPIPIPTPYPYTYSDPVPPIQ